MKNNFIYYTAIQGNIFSTIIFGIYLKKILKIHLIRFVDRVGRNPGILMLTFKISYILYAKSKFIISCLLTI